MAARISPKARQRPTAPPGFGRILTGSEISSNTFSSTECGQGAAEFDLRTLLRQTTAAAHCEVERLYDTLDLTCVPDLRTFLLAHHMAVAAIGRALDRTGGDDPFGLLPLIRSDLEALDCRRMPDPCPGPERSLHPAGLTYVVAGSRLGARILHRRAARAPARRVRAATCYLAAADGDGLWSDWQAREGAAAVARGEGEQIVAAALYGFNCFAEGLHRAREPMHRD